MIAWNVFHGRDWPPDAGLRTRRSRLLRTGERNASHVQVNRDLLPEFTALLDDWKWDVALLQECPPRWAGALAAALSAEAHRSLTSRNWLAALRAPLGRWSPDLLGAWEGGSNLTLVRGPLAAGGIAERRDVRLRRFPERRTVALTRLSGGVCVANLHASTGRDRAEADVARAARAAVDFAGEAPLVLGGDFNMSPADGAVFAELERRHGLGPATGDSIDHLLARGLDIASPPAPLPPERRELAEEGRALRLSDHAPVAATFVAPDPPRPAPRAAA